MISYQVYKVLHLMGVFTVILSLGAVCMHVINGGTKQHPFRKGVGITHGVGLLISLVGGFGLLARLGVAHGGLPGWVWAKLVIWLIFGGVTAILVRKPQTAKPMWLGILVLAVTGAYLAQYKPF
ncbi:MAG: hypothetical protein HC883_02255 [Bdellovibrionaceae bacterium]|nr:hypothetical protein [Pseudobdellovibrionaceae bacterium]